MYVWNTWKKLRWEGENKKFRSRNIKKSWSATLLKKKNVIGVTYIREKKKTETAIFTQIKKYWVNSPKEKNLKNEEN